ncbi:MAG: SDR family NAD(P)-dependent oxidoreductase, partial [Candidatus Acidiferrum sp.]
MPNEKRLSGRVALVTGAAKRIGRFVALRLAAEGADLAIHYGRSEAEAQDTVREIERLGRRAIAISADLTNVAQIQNLIDQTVSHFHRLDILVNNAANFLETQFG